MKKFFKIVGVALGVGILILVISLFILNESLPQGKSGPEADMLAKKMLTALNHQSYEQTRYLEWSFQNGANQYKWDKELGKAILKWDDYRVNLDLMNPEKSKAYQNDQLLSAEEGKGLVEKALKNFNNDSFWLVAPYKVFDSGTKRSVVELEDGTQALLITYTSGGSTPGDSYLWLLDESGFPKSYKMWVKIIPIGGLEASWDDWLVSESGAFLPKSHQLGPINLSMGNVKGYNTK
nr:hypothetical protein [Allomuricauda sp.]